MHCRVCGVEGDSVKYRDRSRMYLCPHCHKETPTKATREEFERIYWEGNSESVPYSTRQDFWEDYKTSDIGPVEEYLAATVVPSGWDSID